MRNGIGFGLLVAAVVVGTLSARSLQHARGFDGYLGLMGLVAALGLGIVGMIVLSRSSNRLVSAIGTGLLVLLLAGNLAMKCADGELPFCSRAAGR